MKVIVKDFLNVRVGKPSVNAPCYQYIAPGSELEVDGKFYKGDTFEGISNWLKDEANNYYWSGATNIAQPSIAITKFNEADFWWLSQYNIGKLWDRGLTGKGVKLVVLDSGLALPHPDLIIKKENIVDFSGSGNTLDQSGHGTHVAGLIKATDNGFGVKGIAFNCDFYFGKVKSDIEGSKVNFLIEGLKWARENVKADIVSISQGYMTDSSALGAEISLLVPDALVICAAGNKSSVTGNDILYPARYPDTISVAGVTKNGNALTDTINESQTGIFAPGEDILSTTLNNGYAERSGSSQAAPFVAGVAALALESFRRTNATAKASAIKGKILAASAKKIIDPLKCI